MLSERVHKKQEKGDEKKRESTCTSICIENRQDARRWLLFAPDQVIIFTLWPYTFHSRHRSYLH